MIRQTGRAGSLPENFKPTDLLVHYSEIALKGKNRPFFEQALVRSLQLALRGLGVSSVKRLYGRIVVQFRHVVPTAEVASRLKSVYGIAHFEPALQVDLDLEKIEETIGQAIEGLSVDSFAMKTQRGNKAFPLNSVEVNRRIGQYVVDRTGWPVSINNPDLPIFLYLLDTHAYLAFQRILGPGGLPVGVAGKVACLLSGGIDSPVAAARMMRRGAEPIFIHFHSAPHTSTASQEKVIDLAQHLMQHDRPTRLYMIPFADLQRRIVTETPAPYRVILYRRFMIRAAEAIALRENARALVTGESLGQVSSQTLGNLATIDAAATLPILRPVVGWDKQEIVEEAKTIGTFDISIEPHDDCCSFLMPRYPATHSTPDGIERLERVFDVGREVETLLENAVVLTVGPAPTPS